MVVAVDRALNLSPVRLALAIKQLRAGIDGIELLGREPVAVVGMSCRFPGSADDTDGFIELLEQGRDAVSIIPADRWNLDAFYDPDPDAPGKMTTRHGAFLSDPYRFDAEFFAISPREAERMDPQQRLVLETGWAALEDAAISPLSIRGAPVGVFVGICANDHTVREFQDSTRIEAYSSSGAAHSIVANRLSYLLDLRGPSVAVDTACSSSLVAVHLACQSLRSAEVDVALAAGVNVVLEPEGNIALSKARMMAADGRCKTFDARADGYVRGEGCGVVVLKRLVDALRDRDPIRAVIRGSAVNQDGRSNGLTAPNLLAQRDLVERALQNAGLEASEVCYVEAHGTGTSLGDPVEVDALREVYGAGSRACGLGSVKTNFGHLEGAAGIAGLIKVVVSLERATIFPHLHFRRMNPSISLDRSRLFVPTEKHSWPPGRRSAAVSSFGFGGTNAHVILEEAPRLEASASLSDTSAQLLTLSARTPAALAALGRRYVRHLRTRHEQAFGDVCFTANTSRTHFAERLALVASTREEAAAALEQVLSGADSAELLRGTTRRETKRVAFLCTGQGSQYVGMGRELYEQEEVFRSTLDRCSEVMGGSGELLRVMFAGEGELDRTEWTQPAMFALGLGLAELWRSWGVEPAAVLGHSVGEYVAACVSGALTLEAGMGLLKKRARLMQGTRGGRMLAVFARQRWVEQELLEGSGELAVAALNAETEVVVSGSGEAVSWLEERCRQAGVKTRTLKTAQAFHSAAMDPILDELERAASEVEALAPRIPLVSNLTGTEMSQAPDAAYWRRHAREPVRFEAGLRSLSALGCDVFIELGPHPVLLALGQQVLTAPELLWLPSLHRKTAERVQLLRSAGALYTRGVEPVWDRISGQGRRRVSLPSYAFQGASLRSARRREAPQPAEVEVPSRLPGKRLRSALSQIQFQARLTHASHPICQHEIQGEVVVPAAAYLTSLLGVARAAGREPAFDRVVFLAPLRVERGATYCLQTIEHVERDDEAFVIASQPEEAPADAAWVAHVRASRPLRAAVLAAETAVDTDELREHMPVEIPCDEFYAQMFERGYQLGKSFRWLERIWSGEFEALGQLRASEAEDACEGDVLPPGLIDACLQLFGITWAGNAEPGAVYVPISVEEFRYRQHGTGRLFCHVRRRASEQEEQTFTGDLRLFDEHGKTVARMVGVCVRRTTSLFAKRARAASCFSVQWRSLPEPEPAAAPVGGTSSWLVLGRSRGFGQRLTDELSARGDKAMLVCPEATAWRSPAWAGNPLSEQLDTVLREFMTSARAGDGVIYLSEFEAAVDGKQLPNVARLGTALALVQARARLQSEARLWFVTRGAQVVEPTDAMDAARLLDQAPLWALGRVAALEHPEFFSGLIDLDPQQEQNPASLARCLRVRDGEPEIAFRASGARVPRLVPEAVEASSSLAIREAATYLITGGLGGVGMASARWLVERGARHLVLVQRSDPSERAQQAIAQLQASGAEIVLARADVSDATQVARVFAQIETTLPKLRGIVHAAATLDDGVLLHQSVERLQRVWAPKVWGGKHLSQESERFELDFFVLFSSVASLFGSPGQSGYAAANAFLDALAWTRRARGLPALAVNFGPWQGVGLTSSLSARDRARFVDQGLAMLDQSAALAALEALLPSPMAQIAVLAADSDLGGRTQDSVSSPLLREFRVAAQHAQEPASLPVEPELLRRLARSRRAERLAVVRRFVQEQAALALGHTQASLVDPRTPLRDVGLDSLMALSLSKALGKGLGRPLPPALVFNHPAVEDITQYIAAQVLSADAPLDASAGAPTLPELLVSELKELSEQELGAAVDEELAWLGRDG
jgi:acyl transferase domain-containing protein/acyl carrier protein